MKYLSFILLVSILACSSPSRLEDASGEQIDIIKKSLVEGYSVVSEFKTVKSKDFKNVYFVGAMVAFPNGEKNYCLWATGGKINISVAFAVGQETVIASTLPDGTASSAKIKETDDGTYDLLKYFLM